jgi:hypothetical protein
MNDWLDIPPDEIAINTETGEARHWDDHKGLAPGWRWASELDKRDLIGILEQTRQRPDVCAPFHGREPLGSPDQPEGPWVTLAGKQIRAIADFTDDGDYSTYRLQYQGAGYWQIETINADGELAGDSQTIWATEA